MDRGMAGGATAGREVGGVMGRVGAFDGPAAQSPTSPHVCPSCARERIERASIIFSGGALVLAVERARSLSRAEAASESWPFGDGLQGPSSSADAALQRSECTRGACRCRFAQPSGRGTQSPGISCTSQAQSVSIQMVASVLRFCTRVQLTGRMHALYEWV